MAEWTMTPEQHRQILHHPAVVAKITELANRLCDNANAIAKDVRKAEKHTTQTQIQKASVDQFAVVVQDNPESQRPRAYVRPVGKTGLHIEAGHSVLFKAIASVAGAQ